MHTTDRITPLPDVTSIFDPTCLKLSGQSVIYSSNWLQTHPASSYKCNLLPWFIVYIFFLHEMMSFMLKY